MSSDEGNNELNDIKNGSNEDAKSSQGYQDTSYGNVQSQAGCTANVCLLYKNELYCANAGDSRTV